jgi:chromate transporter
VTELSNQSPPNLRTSTPTFREALPVWASIGILSFGGPTAQIALMHRVLVEEKQWTDEARFLSALSFCMLLPGPEAMQLATYVGWKFHGTRGGLAAGLLFVFPGAIVVLTLAAIYAAFGNVPFISALFLGIKSAVIVIVVEALLRIARRALKGAEYWLVAASSFLAIFFFSIPFPLVILIAAMFGALRVSNQNPEPIEFPTRRTVQTTLRTFCLWLLIWWFPLIALAAYLGSEHILFQLGLFFSKLALVTFGGAYAVLAYMAQDVVTHCHWLDAGTMLDGLGLAETTPGPLILVTEFVGYVAAYRNVSNYPVAFGLLGAAIALWATFAPCFLWIFVGAPYIDWIIAQPRLRNALTAVMAAVVGVILNLAIWFALHVFFREGSEVSLGKASLWMPMLSSIDVGVVALTFLATVLLIHKKWNIAMVLAVCAACSVGLVYIGI